MSESKVLKVLEKTPTGLSISEIAKQSNLHRNTVTRVINKLQERGKVELKRVGLAKIYYLKKYAGLYKMESGYKGKNISVGLGVSDLQDGYKAAVSAAKQAAMQCSKGKVPSFSLVFVSSKYNSQIKRVVRGINTVLGTENWIGCTTDREINSILGYSEGTIEVLCIDTKYMHFGVGLSKDYRKNPVEEGRKATKEAIENCPVERSKFATAQFMRGTKQVFSDIIKNPPYFVLTLIGGSYFKKGKAIPGLEPEFLEGIKEVLGPFIPIVGASSSSNIEKMQKGDAENYVFAGGKYYKEGAVICFIVSELYFSCGMEHPYIPTDKYGIITKVSKNGKIIEEINNKPALVEYNKMVANVRRGVRTKIGDWIERYFAGEFESLLKILKNPLMLFDALGNTYPLTLIPNKDKTFSCPQGITENISVKLGRYDENRSINNTCLSISKSIEDMKAVVSFCVLFSCSARGLLLSKSKKIDRFVEKLNQKLDNYIGFYAIGEIGIKGGQTSRFTGFSDVYLLIFDRLITE